MKIASIDFETANYSRVSMCAAGLALFADDELVESLSWLVRPPQGHDWFVTMFTEEIHGLRLEDVQDAPEFPAVAPEFLARLAQADLVIAHNAAFDTGVLRATLNHFGLVMPEFDYACTCSVARRIWPELPNHQLNTLAAHIGHEFQHHQAQADAETAGRVWLGMMKHAGATTVEELLGKAGVGVRKFVA